MHSYTSINENLNRFQPEYVYQDHPNEPININALSSVMFVNLSLTRVLKAIYFRKMQYEGCISNVLDCRALSFRKNVLYGTTMSVRKLWNKTVHQFSLLIIVDMWVEKRVRIKNILIHKTGEVGIHVEQGMFGCLNQYFGSLRWSIQTTHDLGSDNGLIDVMMDKYNESMWMLTSSDGT